MVQSIKSSKCRILSTSNSTASISTQGRLYTCWQTKEVHVGTWSSNTTDSSSLLSTAALSKPTGAASCNPEIQWYILFSDCKLSHDSRISSWKTHHPPE